MYYAYLVLLTRTTLIDTNPIDFNFITIFMTPPLVDKNIRDDRARDRSNKKKTEKAKLRSLYCY